MSKYRESINMDESISVEFKFPIIDFMDKEINRITVLSRGLEIEINRLGSFLPQQIDKAN